MLAHLFTPAFLGISLGGLAKTIVNDVAGGLFGALAKALMPQAVSNNILGFLGWLVSLPNLTGNAQAPLTDVTSGYGDVTTLVQQITWLAFGLVPVAVSTNALRFMAGTFHRGNQVDGFVKVAISIVGLAVWPDLLRMGIDLFNTITIGILNLPVVKTDFRNVMGVLTGATAAYGGLGAVGGLLMIGLDVIVITMIVMKVAMTAILGILFVAAPIAIALWPIPEFSKIVQLIGMVLFGILMIPLLWVITFATAGAFTGGILAHPGPLGKELMSVCAGLLCFALAIFIPKFVLGRITMIAGGVGGMTGMLRGGGGARHSASGATNGTSALERMGHMRSGLLHAGIAGSRGAGYALSAFGGAGVAAGFGLKGLRKSGHLSKLHDATRSATGRTAAGKAVGAAGTALSGKWAALNDWAKDSSSRTAGAARVGMAAPAALATSYGSMQPPAHTSGAGNVAKTGATRPGVPKPTTDPAGARAEEPAGVRSRRAAASAATKSGRGQDGSPAGWRAAEPVYQAALNGNSPTNPAPSNAAAAAAAAGAHRQQQARRVFVADANGQLSTSTQPAGGKPKTPSTATGLKPDPAHEQMRRITWSFRNRSEKQN